MYKLTPLMGLLVVLSCQVSELSHKLGSAQGSSQSMEQEVAQLRIQLKQLAGEKHSLEMQLSDTKAKLLALQEKVWSMLLGVKVPPGVSAGCSCLISLLHRQIRCAS